MAKNFVISKEKTLNSALFILQRLGGAADFHKLFKIMYFADQKHLAKYGLPISGDYYKAMKDGPVPSALYGIFQYLREGNTWYVIAPHCHDLFEIHGRYTAVAKQQPDLEELSQSNINCLIESIEENKNLGFGALKEKSHKAAWDAAQNDDMDIVDIALEGGASEEMVKYIETNLENQFIFTNYAKSW